MTPALRKALELHPPAMGAGAALMSTLAEDEIAERTKRNRIRESLTTEEWGKKLIAFFEFFGQPRAAELGKLSAAQELLEGTLLIEESKETIEAAKREDLVEVVDGLLDTIYVSLHWLVALGLNSQQINILMDEVHASNMTKADDDGQALVREDGKILKGANFIPPAIRTLLHEWGFPVSFSMECAD